MKTDAVQIKKSFWAENRKSGGYLLKKKLKKWGISLVRWLLVFGLCFMIIQPLIIRLSTSLMPESDLYDSTVVLVPRSFTFDNFKLVFQFTDFPNSMINTLWTSILMATCQVVSCTLVAYGFARFEFPLKKFWFVCVVGMIVIPPQTYATSLYVFFSNFDIFGLVKLITGNSVNLKGSVTPYVLMSLTCTGLKNGLYIYMLMQYFKGVPKSLEEAAFMDGCGTMHTFTKIMLPDAAPIIISCFLFAFVWQWTDLFYTRNFLSSMSIFSNRLSTITADINRYYGSGSGNAASSASAHVPAGRQQQLISIGVLVCSLPLILLYSVAQRFFVESIAVTGMKM